MTPRERSLKVLHRELPDRVPVMPGYGTWYASRVCGGDLFDLEDGRLNGTKLIVDITRKYGCEFWYWVGYGDGLGQVWSDGEAEGRTEKQIVDDDTYVTTTTLTTPIGILTSDQRHNRINPEAPLTGLIKDPVRDWPIYRRAQGDNWRWGTRPSLADIPEDDLALGVTSFALGLPVDFWKDLRCDTALAVMDMLDGLREMDEAMEWQRHYSLQHLAARLALEPLPDMIHLQGSSSSLSVISPDIYRRYNLEFVQAVCTAAHQQNVPVQIHHCGKSAGLVDILCEETDIDIIHPLEPPPGGDVDLAQVKKRYGDRLILMGNLNTYQLMLFGTPEEVREATRKCIDAAAGGGFILANGDQLGRDTPEENVMAMVEAAHEFGRY